MCQPETSPAWLLEHPRELINSRKQRLSFLRKTITHISNIFNAEIYFSKTAALNGVLQLIDPRVKFISILAFIILINLTHSIVLLGLISGLTIIYAKISFIPVARMLCRSWLVIPLFVFMCSIPALFNIVVPGKSVLTLYSANPAHTLLAQGLYITDNGLTAVGRMVMRSGCSLSMAYLLLTTTRWNDLTRGLALMKFPVSFILILDMTYRYIFLLANTSLQMSEARFLRTIGNLSPRENRRFFGHSIAVLFIKSNYLAGEIFNAMRCRGFRHKVVNLRTFKLSKLDYLFLLTNVLILLLLSGWSNLHK